MNVIKSLVVWETTHRESQKQNKSSESSEDEVSPIDMDEIKSGEDSPSNFEKLKAHKSTIEAVVSEVRGTDIMAYDWHSWKLDIFFSFCG